MSSAAPKVAWAAVESGPANRGGRMPIRFNLLAASWTDPRVGEIEVRTSPDGRTWSSWQHLDVTEGEAPDAGTDEARTWRRERFSALLWVGEARYAQTRGLPRGKLHLLNVNGDADDPGPAQRALRSFARWTAGTPAHAAGGGPLGIYTRGQWGSDESLREQTLPNYASRNKLAFIHHTDTGNGYAASQVPGIIRGIYAFHVKNRGYRDIAYNFLIDRFGQIWEGRWGGMDKTVVGGHTAGFNTGTIGVAWLGNYSTSSPSAAMQAATARLLSWKFTVHNIRARSNVTVTTGTSPAGGIRWPAGTQVSLNTVSAHRDVNQTSCNGTYGYRTLNWIRGRIWNKLPPTGTYVFDGWRNWVLGPTGREYLPADILATRATQGEVHRLGASDLNSYDILGWGLWRDGTLVRSDAPLPSPEPSPTAGPEPDPTASPQAPPGPTGSPSASPTASPTPGEPAHYIVSGGRLRPFASLADLVSMGYNPSRIIQSSAPVLARYRVGPVVEPEVYPNGTLIQWSAGGTVFLIKDGRRKALHYPVFGSWRFSADEIVKVDKAVLDAIPPGGTLPLRDGTLVRGDASPAIWVISNGTRRQIVNWFVFSLLGYSKSTIRVLPQAIVDMHLRGAALDGRGPQPL